MSKKVFVLRTHALLARKRSTLQFGDDNIIVIPMAVIDEIRAVKKQSFEKGRIARDLLEYINSFPTKELLSKEGVKQENGSILRVSQNFFNVEVQAENLTVSEKRTLQICLGLMQEEEKKVILVTNNLSLQLKAKAIGINAESLKDETFPRLPEQYTGREEIFTDDQTINDFYNNGFINKEDIFEYKNIEFVNNKFFIIKTANNRSALGIFKNARIEQLRFDKMRPYGITAKNVGQKFVIEALMDEEIPIVVIKGNAGTGKTFCALAVGLEKAFNNNVYSRILVTRSVTASEQYGFLPGDIEEKLSPYLAGIKDNLSILYNAGKGHELNNRFSEKPTSEQGWEYLFEKRVVQIQAIGFLRGRSIVDTYFIIDETQNIDPDIIKSIVTRAGQGSKFIFLGDPTQIDNPNLTERYNGLVYLSEKMKGNPMCMQLSLTDDESVRSELAKQAAKIL